tara:strand:- start:68 stop:193 length:126 start_codon:yes stop_codon:yes gene_type:complete
MLKLKTKPNNKKIYEELEVEKKPPLLLIGKNSTAKLINTAL